MHARKHAHTHVCAYTYIDACCVSTVHVYIYWICMLFDYHCYIHTLSSYYQLCTTKCADTFICRPSTSRLHILFLCLPIAMSTCPGLSPSLIYVDIHLTGMTHNAASGKVRIVSGLSLTFERALAFLPKWRSERVCKSTCRVWNSMRDPWLVANSIPLCSSRGAGYYC